MPKRSRLSRIRRVTSPPARRRAGRGRTLPADAGTAWRHGLRLGLYCSHCCAGLTAILLVIGVMNPRAMAVVAAVITVERLAPAGERVARAIGAGVVGTGLFLKLQMDFAGEAEKSHQKARADGYHECWTVVNVDRIDLDMARRESPSTNRFYRLSQIDGKTGDEYIDLRNGVVSLTAILSP